ncbi:MAG: hypothetical protein BroJett029_23780 [Alphaproteobacteria bacterium]|nr:MAG: hypothetical protein BroJett029_23780 [Alphaproteobacteria bacterium]
MAACARDSTAGRLAGLHALEWRHDGPIPTALLARLDATGEDLARRGAAADEALLDNLAREAVRAVAAARREAGRAGPDGHPAATQLTGCRARALAFRRGRG